MARLTILTLLLLSLNCSGCRRLQGVCPSGVIEGSLAIHNGEVTTFNNLAWEEDWGPIEDVPLNKCRTVRGDLWITDGMRELRKLNSIEEVAGVITFLDVTGDLGALRDIFPALRTASGLRGAQAVGRFDVMSGFGSLVSIGFIQDDGFGAAGFEGFGRLETARTIVLGGTPFPRFESLREVGRFDIWRPGGDAFVLPSLARADSILVEGCAAPAVAFPELASVATLRLAGALNATTLDLRKLVACTNLELISFSRLSDIFAPALTSIDGHFKFQANATNNLAGFQPLERVGGTLTITDNRDLSEPEISEFISHVVVGGPSHVCRNEGMPLSANCDE